jgi:type II secretory pathway predicted ATPase ExeA
MINITAEFRQKIIEALLQQRNQFSGSDKEYATQFGINLSVYNRVKNGDHAVSISSGLLINIARELDITIGDKKWHVAKTAVYETIKDDITNCQAYGKSLMCVDDCGIGKTFTAKYLSKTLKNCFYVDASQAKTKMLFIKLLAKTIGVDYKDKYYKMKANIKYALNTLQNPVVIIDEAGDLDYNAFLELKEFWNATDEMCGWYLIGADGLREKIARGIGCKKVGYAEIFSRFGERYTEPVPKNKQEKLKYMKQLITDVLRANMKDLKQMNSIVARCLINDDTGHLGGLRRAKLLLTLNQMN